MGLLSIWMPVVSRSGTSPISPIELGGMNPKGKAFSCSITLPTTGVLMRTSWPLFYQKLIDLSTHHFTSLAKAPGVRSARLAGRTVCGIMGTIKVCR